MFHKQVLGVDYYEFTFYSYFVLVLPYCEDIWSTNVQNLECLMTLNQGTTVSSSTAGAFVVPFKALSQKTLDSES